MFAKTIRCGVVAWAAISVMGSARALPGDLDPSFGQQGWVRPAQGNTVLAEAMADGRIVTHEETSGLCVGWSCPVCRPGLARYLADGRIDSSFGVLGRVAIGWETCLGSALTVQTDGGILVATDSHVTRVRADGSRDLTFGGSGRLDIPFSEVPSDPQAAGAITQLVPMADGRVLVVGRYGVSNVQMDFGLALITADGRLDAGFGQGGVVHSGFASGGTSVLRTPDGRLLAVGTTGPARDFEMAFEMARFLADGRMDTTFGEGGQVVTRFGNDGRPVPTPGAGRFWGGITHLALLPDGRILAMGPLCRGDWVSGNFWCTLGLVRYLPGGAVDASFRNGAQPGFWGMTGKDLHVQPDGSILVALDSGIARFSADGIADSGYANGGLARVAFPLGNFDLGAQILGDGRVLFRTGLGLARYLTDTSNQGLVPESGLWVIDAENGSPGRGFQVEVQRDLLMMVVNGYEADGSATFHVAGGSYRNAGFSGDLVRYAGGTPLGALGTAFYRPAHETGTAGRVTLEFTDRTHGVITLPGEMPKPFSKFDFGVPKAQELFVAPIAGLWIIDEEAGGPGRGFLLEAQQQAMVMVFDGYTRAGEPTFYYAAAPIVQDPWTQWSADLGLYADGRSFGSGPRAAHLVGNAGQATIRLSSGTRGYLSLPGEGPTGLIRKFDFGLQ